MWPPTRCGACVRGDPRADRWVHLADSCRRWALPVVKNPEAGLLLSVWTFEPEPGANAASDGPLTHLIQDSEVRADPYSVALLTLGVYQR